MSKKKSNWIVRLKCEVIKEVYADDCTEEQATQNPLEHATGETEIDQRDWEVVSVHENN